LLWNSSTYREYNGDQPKFAVEYCKQCGVLKKIHRESLLPLIQHASGIVNRPDFHWIVYQSSNIQQPVYSYTMMRRQNYGG